MTVSGMMCVMRLNRGLLSVTAGAIAAATAVALLTASPSTSKVSTTNLSSTASVTGTETGSTVPSLGGTSTVSPAAGVHTERFCGSWWKNVRPGGGTGYNIYNDNFGAGTCLTNKNNAAFTIVRSTANGAYGAFPNISSGWQWGIEPLHSYTYPVKEKDDGHPISSVSVHLINSGTYNAAYDMWFSTYKQTDGQNNAAEVMIWLTCRNNCLAGTPVRIEGVWFLKRTWIAYHNGVHWRYTAYVAESHRSYFNNLWLNPFYQNAGVNPNWYLTSIDFGFELVTGGTGLAVNSYSLRSVS
jgi:hypothetical protein